MKEHIIIWGERAFGPFTAEEAMLTWRRLYAVSREQSLPKPYFMLLENGPTE